MRKRLLAFFLAMIMLISTVPEVFAVGGNERIQSFRAELVSGASSNGAGDLVWTPSDSSAGHSFVYRVSYALSGEGMYGPGKIEIRVPKSILIDKNGAPRFNSRYHGLTIRFSGTVIALPGDDNPNRRMIVQQDGFTLPDIYSIVRGGFNITELTRPRWCFLLRRRRTLTICATKKNWKSLTNTFRPYV